MWCTLPRVVKEKLLTKSSPQSSVWVAASTSVLCCRHCEHNTNLRLLSGSRSGLSKSFTMSEVGTQLGLSSSPELWVKKVAVGGNVGKMVLLRGATKDCSDEDFLRGLGRYS